MKKNFSVKILVTILSLAVVFVLGYAVGKKSSEIDSGMQGTYTLEAKTFSISEENSAYHYTDAASGTYITGSIALLDAYRCELLSSGNIPSQVVSNVDGSLCLVVDGQKIFLKKGSDQVIIVDLKR